MSEEITCTNEALEMARLWEKAGPGILAKRAAKHFDVDDMDEVALYIVRKVQYYHSLSHKIMNENVEKALAKEKATSGLKIRRKSLWEGRK
jgi:hypothetical protein